MRGAPAVLSSCLQEIRTQVSKQGPLHIACWTAGEFCRRKRIASFPPLSAEELDAVNPTFTFHVPYHHHISENVMKYMLSLLKFVRRLHITNSFSFRNADVYFKSWTLKAVTNSFASRHVLSQCDNLCSTTSTKIRVRDINTSVASSLW